MTQPCPDKTEPAPINHEARKKLVDEISKRVSMAAIVSTRNIGFAKDYADKAMIEAEAYSLPQAEKELAEVAAWLGYAVSQLKSDIQRIKEHLIPLAKEIQKGEEDAKSS